jgi:hypothetical protein
MFGKDVPACLPGGAYFPVGQDHGVGVELTVVNFNGVNIPEWEVPAFWQVWLSGGPMIKLTRPGELSGFFLQPKVLAVYSNERATPVSGPFTGIRNFPAGQSFELAAGADLGYHHVIGPLFIGTQLGASAGYCINCSTTGFSSLLGPWAWGFGERRNRPTVEINVNLLKLGLAF